MRKVIYIVLFTMCLSTAAWGADKLQIHKPDLEKIKAETTDQQSQHYYPKLLAMFMSNDTVMTADDYRYFYYGTLYQEDFDPYRQPYDQEKLDEITPLYYKSGHSQDEKATMMRYARAAIEDNPLDLVQLKNLIYVYEQNGKINLAKIWKNKLNHLLETIASSGTGLDTDNAWIVVYPRHEFEFLNISGITVQDTEFEPPYYERVYVNKKSEKDPDAYIFNIQPVLEQYYIKHPSEAD